MAVTHYAEIGIYITCARQCSYMKNGYQQFQYRSTRFMLARRSTSSTLRRHWPLSGRSRPVIRASPSNVNQIGTAIFYCKNWSKSSFYHIALSHASFQVVSVCNSCKVLKEHPDLCTLKNISSLIEVGRAPDCKLN